MTRYLGGNPTADVVMVKFSMVKVAPAAAVCVAKADGAFSTGPLRGALGGSDSAYLRRCVNDVLTPVEVRCSERHTQEYVGLRDGTAPTAAQCDEAAESYMNVDLSRVYDHLAVDVVQSVKLDITHPRCVIRIRGSDSLTDTVRNIGTNTLPIVSG